MSRLPSANGKPKFTSGTQVVVAGMRSRDGHAELHSSRDAGYGYQRLYEDMLRDPTIKLALDVIAAMLKRLPWTVEGEDPEYCEFVWKNLEQYRELIVRSCLRGGMRYGWRAFELLYDIDGETGWNSIVGLKPLKNTYTKPLVFEDTGEFAGVEVQSVSGSFQQPETIDAEHVLLVNFDDEGHGDLGEPMLRPAVGPHIKWTACDEGAQRYDRKVAGGFLFVRFPVGTTPYSQNGGERTDNSVIAVDLANSMEAAGYAIAPINVDPETGEPLEKGIWSIEHIGAQGGLQPNFIVREKYLDALKLRAFGIPERTVTEGTFGTKAEAEAHADVAVLINVDRIMRVIQAINDGPLAVMNETNIGDKQAATLTLGKLDPQDRELFATIFQTLMADPVFAEGIAEQIDGAELLDRLNVPTLTEDEIEENKLELEEEQAALPDEEIAVEDDEEVILEE